MCVSLHEQQKKHVYIYIYIYWTTYIAHMHPYEPIWDAKGSLDLSHGPRGQAGGRAGGRAEAAGGNFSTISWVGKPPGLCQ